MIDCINILFWLLIVYQYILIAGVIMSWFPFLYNFKIFRLIHIIGSWYIEPFRGVLVLGPIDFTPIIGFFLYQGILDLLVYLL